MKVWMIATYKINEAKKLEENLKNQDFEYYIPKIKTKKLNSPSKEEPLFPGYVFVHASLGKFTKLKYSKGITNIICFKSNVAILQNNEIHQLRIIEKKSYSEPIIFKVLVGQEVTISEGPLKGSFVTIASLPKRDRINIFINILGSKRIATVSLNEIVL